MKEPTQQEIDLTLAEIEAEDRFNQLWREFVVEYPMLNGEIFRKFASIWFSKGMICGQQWASRKAEIALSQLAEAVRRLRADL